MHLHDFNPDSSKPLLHLAHANGFPPQTYQKAIQSLLPHYHIVSLLARPLWGDTPPEWLDHWSRMADDLIEGLDALGARDIVGAGHSLGGVLTLYASVKRPELFHRIVLIDPTMLPPGLLWRIKWMKLFGMETRGGLVQGALRRRREWESLEAAYLYFRGRPLFKDWDDETVRAYAESMTGPAPEGGVRLVYPPEWEARIYRTIPMDVWKYAARLNKPVLVIRGAMSNTFTAESEEAFRRSCPAVVSKTVQGAGHLAPQEKPEEIGALVQEFLAASRD